MRLTLLLMAGIQFLTVSALAAAPSAEELMKKAQAKATSEHKAIFVHFGASWCGWCKRLDSFLDSAPIKPVFEKYFVPVKLVVQEGEKNKPLENAGAEALLSKLGGPAGLPYSAFLDSHGALIVNSRLREGENIGYPAEAKEIDWFVEMIKKAAPQITPDDLKTIESALRVPKKNS